jgi:hypothetical protein
MKILLTTLFIFYLLIKPTVKTQWECNVHTIFQSIPPIIFYEQTIDGKIQAPLVTRFLHNKPGIFMSQFAKCYTHNLEPLEVFTTVGIVGLFFWANFIYVVLTRKNWLLLSVFLIIPAISIFIIDQRITDYSYKIFAILGFIFFLKKFK